MDIAKLVVLSSEIQLGQFYVLESARTLTRAEVQQQSQSSCAAVCYPAWIWPNSMTCCRTSPSPEQCQWSNKNLSPMTKKWKLLLKIFLEALELPQCIWYVAAFPLISCTPVRTSLVYAMLCEGEAAVQMLTAINHTWYIKALHTCKRKVILSGLSSQHPLEACGQASLF